MPSKKETPKKGTSKNRAAKAASSKTKPAPAKTASASGKAEGRAQEILRKGLLGESPMRAQIHRPTDGEPRALSREVDQPGEVAAWDGALNKVNPAAAIPMGDMPQDIRNSVQGLPPRVKRFHGVKLNLGYFPFSWLRPPYANKFGYFSPAKVRSASRLPFTLTTQSLLEQLGALMGNPDRDGGGDSVIPAGYTYLGQFVDHDITMDVSSTLEEFTDANTIDNMRSPALDLDSLYARGPGLDPFLYVFPTSGPETAIKFALGTNSSGRAGGPGGARGAGGMRVQSDFDVPRMHNPLNSAAGTRTAIIGDPRNDENLIVSQFHHAMLKFHNRVVDLLIAAAYTGDIFVEAKKRVIHHYQWAVVNDYLERICGPEAINASAIAQVNAPTKSPFRMPVEFSVAAYRMGHSMIRNQYWVNFTIPNASLAQVFGFIRPPEIPVQTERVVDFNAFFDTGVSVPVNNKARKIDSVLASGLESIPGGSGIMAILATRNLKRSLALGLPSGQAMARFFGIMPMTGLQLTQGLPADEVTLLNSSRGLLLRRTPLWYYILREAAVLSSGNRLGPVGGKIVADTFIRMLKRDESSYLNAPGRFTPMLPSATPGTFTVADIIKFARVNEP